METVVCCLVSALWKNRPHDAERLLGEALDCLKLRGLNDGGAEFQSFGHGALALSHARLSVIDLSAAGHQPMQSADGRDAIIFHGEIYNYRELLAELQSGGEEFVSAFESEVLLRV